MNAVEILQSNRAEGINDALTAQILSDLFRVPKDRALAMIYEYDKQNSVVVCDPPKPESAAAPVTEPAPPLNANLWRSVPETLKVLPQWVQWRLEERGGKLTKVPYVAGTSRHASATDPATWSTFETATQGVTPSEIFGIGFVLGGAATDIVGVDLDGCRNPKTGAVKPWAQEIVDNLDSYTEVTPSQTGLRVWVRGKFAADETDNVFLLDPSIGFGSKVRIEIFTDARYFTVTGQYEDIIISPFIEDRDLSSAYRACELLRQQFPAPKTTNLSGATGQSSAQIQVGPGMIAHSKLSILMNGTIVSREPFRITYLGNTVEYPSHSEADMALLTELAAKFGDDVEKIAAEFERSALYYRDRWEKWDRLKDDQIAKAIKFVEKDPFAHSSAMTLAVPTTPDAPAVLVARPVMPGAIANVPTEADIPAFDDSVITGIFRTIVDTATNGTTIPRQFAFLAAKVYIGALMSEMTFEGLDTDSCIYGTVIAKTGTGKGLAWRRTFDKILNPKMMLDKKVKYIASFDSGAGLKDAFFEPPQDQPIICYVDEVTSLGHKAGERKQPEILDTIIELAESRVISRTLAKKKKKMMDNARLCLYMCGQDGETYMSAFAGKTKLGLWDRFYPEYSPAVDAGKEPTITQEIVLDVHVEINKLTFKGHLEITPEAEARLDAFWAAQGELKKKVRFLKNIKLDAYMAAFSLGKRQVEIEDVDVAIRIFTRQLIIRQVTFTTEVPDKVGLYVAKIKGIVEDQHRRLLAGEPIEEVALSIRDFQTRSHSYRDNELQVFGIAWNSFIKRLAKVNVVAKNGHSYEKWVPVPEEHETWAPPPQKG